VLQKHHSVAEISKNCLTLASNLLTLPLEMRRDIAWKCRPGRVATVGALILASLLAACGSAPKQAQVPPEQAVKALAQERWNALIAGDVSRVYGYMSPAARQALSLEAFRDSIRLGFFQKADVVKVECQPDVCDVQLQVAYVYRGSSIVTPVRESWIRSGDGWWHVFKPA
jgi:hypothetical protein